MQVDFKTADPGDRDGYQVAADGGIVTLVGDATSPEQIYRVRADVGRRIVLATQFDQGGDTWTPVPCKVATQTEGYVDIVVRGFRKYVRVVIL